MKMGKGEGGRGEGREGGEWMQREEEWKQEGEGGRMQWVGR